MKLSRRQRYGVSLVEILIALAVLVIGILAVLRIFPKGLGTLSQVADRNEALRLAEAESAKLQAVSGRLPDFILPAGQPTEIVASAADFGFLRMPANAAEHRPYDYDLPYYDSNDPGLLHRLLADDRLVVGERALVGRRVAADSGGMMVTAARPYHTLFGPIAPQVQRDANGDPILDGNGNEQPLTDINGNQLAELAVLREFKQVSVLDLRRTIVTGAGQQYRDRPVFAVVDGGRDDFTGAPAADRLLFELDSTARLFVVRCAYRDAYGNVLWVQLQPLVLPAVAVPSPTSYYEVPLVQPQPPNAAITDVIPESVIVRQVLNRDPATTGTLNRFDYRDQEFKRGVLFFSPALSGEDVGLEYVVEDWRNLSEELDLATDGAGAITSPANNELQLTGGRFLDETFVPRVVVLATGQTIPVDQALWTADPGYARQGIIPITAGTTLDPVAGSRAIRVFYRKFGNWAVAPDIAPTAYILTYDAAGLTSTGNVVDYPVQNLLVDVLPGPVDGADAYTELWFRPSEAGQTVAVTYEVIDPTNGRELISGEVHVVPTQANRTDSGSGAPRHGIVLARPNVATDGNASLPRPLIHTVEGRSLQIRVAYDEDVPGMPVAPTVTTPVPGVDYLTAERLVELSTYVRRAR